MRTLWFSMNLPFRRATAGALLLGLALIFAVAGCSSSDDPTNPFVLPPLSRIVIALGSDTTVVADTLALGGGLTFSATIHDTGNAVVPTTPIWTSSNPAVFTVNSAGGVSAIGEGSAWLFASAGNVADSVSLLVLSSASGWVVQVSNSSRTLNDVFVGLQSSGGNVAYGTNEHVMFGGRRTVTLPAGRSVYSDPVTLRFVNRSSPALLHGRRLAVSFHTPGPTGPMTWRASARISRVER